MAIQEAPHPPVAVASTDADAALTAAQDALIAEWTAADTSTSVAVRAFYERSQAQAAEQAAWHATEQRQLATALVVQCAQQIPAAHIVDIGCGAGQDLVALRDALPAAVLTGVEPNMYQRRQATEALGRGSVCAQVADAPLETADLLICIDVLEHVPDPEAFLTHIAQRAPVGCVLFEMTATHDIANPLHLQANWGWHPGRVLDRFGWQLASYGGPERVHVWKRAQVAAPPQTGVLLCAYRAVGAQTVNALNALAAFGKATDRTPCRAPTIKHGDGLICRSRSILASRWWAETADDVFLMLDDDIIFQPNEVLDMIDLCREKRSIVCGGYPVGDASHLALRVWDDQPEFPIGPNAPPIAIEYAATGMMACHRAVLDALIPTLPLCHASEPWAFWPMFDTAVIPMGQTLAYVSEDWGFSYMARQAGFTIWMDTRVIATHIKEVGINLNNMVAMHAAITQQ